MAEYMGLDIPPGDEESGAEPGLPTALGPLSIYQEKERCAPLNGTGAASKLTSQDGPV